MPGRNQTLDVNELDEISLAKDPRWALVQRIVASEHFRRADQLRKILIYISRNAILKPHRSVRESEIAVEVLGRKADFNPASDNIVRAQFSHLRRRLEAYFAEEGRSEAIVLTVPKGGYSPAFAHSLIAAQDEPPRPRQAPDSVEAVLPSLSSAGQEASIEERPPRRIWRALAAVSCVAALLVGEFFWLTNRRAARPNDETSGRETAFAQFLSRRPGPVTIVAPDIGLLTIGQTTATNISVADYVSGDYPQRQLAMVKDPEAKAILQSFNSLRATTIWEAAIAFDFKEVLARAGLPATVRYARDLHVQDLSQGNSILIGGQDSNPWTSLFTDRLNFHFVERREDYVYYFENERPAPGEQARYDVIYPQTDRAATGYVDVALIQNPSRSGYILLIFGADAQASEAAARFLLHGTLPPQVVSLLARKDLSYFELLLRGRHVAQEADDDFELVTIRPK
jgi:hypothetical protein